MALDKCDNLVSLRAMISSGTKSYLTSLTAFLAISIGISLIVFQLTKDAWFLRMLEADVSRVEISTTPLQDPHIGVNVSLMALNSKGAYLLETQKLFELVAQEAVVWDAKVIEELVKKQIPLPKHITARICQMVLSGQPKIEILDDFIKRNNL
jgi:hypothetical protein